MIYPVEKYANNLVSILIYFSFKQNNTIHELSSEDFELV